MKKILLTCSVIVIALISYFYISNKNRPPQNLNTTVVNSIHLPKQYEKTTFKVPEIITKNEELELNWTYDPSLLEWGDIVFVCLIGFDTQTDEIEILDSPNCYADNSLFLGTTTLSSKRYKIDFQDIADKFKVPVEYYGLSMRVIDTGLNKDFHDFNGVISRSESGVFKIK